MQAIKDFFVNLWNDIVEFFNTNGVSLLSRTLIALVVLVLGHYLIKLIRLILMKAFNLKTKVVDRNAKSFIVSFIILILRLCLFFGLVAILQIPMNNFVSIISVAVLAIGLSIQDTIGNFANGILILTSKPFVSGDYVEMDEGIEGTVKSTDMLYTTLVTADNKEIIIPNKIVMNAHIINHTKNKTRRVSITFSVDILTPIDKIRKTLVKASKSYDKILLVPEPELIVSSITNGVYNVSFRVHCLTDDYWDVLYKMNEIVVDALAKAKIQTTGSQIAVNIQKGVSK